MIRSPVFESQSETITHGFLGRQGGVSTGLYESLNCGPGSNDDAAAVAENRQRALSLCGLDGSDLVTCHQVHSPDVVVAHAPWDGEPPKADALVTDRADLALGILTADCAPVLFCDARARVIGAAHAGWKGAVSGVLSATVETMESLGANRAGIIAAVGPCIHQQSYEVGPEFEETVTGEDRSFSAFFRAGRGDRLLFDLPGFVASRLRAAGVRTIGPSPADTKVDGETYFSYRRTTINGEPDYGRQLSLIALNGV
ncbi:MAG: peptidoglycan editing factor PgeF [Magnetovibrionaceae bacterium]